MKTRSIFYIAMFGGVSMITAGFLQAQNKSGYPSAEPGLYRSVETPIVIKSDSTFRKGNEIVESPDYPAFPLENEEKVKEKVVIPPPPISTQEPEIIKASPIPTPTPRVKPEPIAPAPTSTPDIPEMPEPVVRNTYIRPDIPEVEIPRTYTPPAPINRYPAPIVPTPVATPVPYHPELPEREIFHPEQPNVMARPVAPTPSALPHSRDFPPSPGNQNPSNLNTLRNVANQIARQGIEFRFGRSHPAFGGLDSSGAVQYLLNEIGMAGVPRTTNGLNSWARVNSMLNEFRTRPTAAELTQSLVPGNLVFWGDPLNGRLSHVMIYLGYDAIRERHLAFGTRGGTEVGINRNEVDIFDLKLDRERIVATGPIPGLNYNF